MYAYNRLVSSSLDSHLAFAADHAMSSSTEKVEDYQKFTYSDPTYDGSNKSKKFLTGQQAFEAAIASTTLGTGYAPGFFQQKASAYVQLMANDTDKSNPYRMDGKPYDVDDDAISLGAPNNNFPATLVSDASEEEKKIYEDVMTLIKSNGNLDIADGPIMFAINAEKSFSFKDINQRADFDSNTKLTDIQKFLDLPDANMSYFYPSISLMLMLLEICNANSGIAVTGEFAFYRGSNLGSSESYMTELEKSTSTISDHAFGRAFDILGIGLTKNTKKQFINLNPEKWAEYFEMFIAQISNLPIFLQPDSITISKKCYDTYIRSGEDPNGSKIKDILILKYPGLSKYITFSTDSEDESIHENHIHVSFGYERAGNAKPLMKSDSKSNSENPSLGTPTISITPEVKEVYLAAGKKAYNTGETMPRQDIANLLVALGLYNKEEIATIIGIMERESRFQPRANNPQGAMGLMQIVLTNNSVWTNMDLPIFYGNSSNLKAGRTINGYLLRNKSYSSIEISKNSKWDATTVDEVFWYPINQMIIMAFQMNAYVGQPNHADQGARTPKQSLKLWSNWGDGAWGRRNDQMPYGVISGVDIDTVRSTYEALGGSWDSYNSWASQALVDETKTGGVVRPKDISEHNQIKDKEASAPYRNQSDITVWLNAKPKLYADNKPREFFPLSIADADAIIAKYPHPTKSSTDYEYNASAIAPLGLRIQYISKWLSEKRVQEFLIRYRPDLEGNINCDRFARILAQTAGLFGATANDDLAKYAWKPSGQEPNITVATADIKQYASAAQRYLAVKDLPGSFFPPGTASGDNPPAGYAVFWTGGDNDFGHNGISIGDGKYVDQHFETSPRNISDTNFPGSKYTYVGSSSKFQSN